MVNYDSVIDKLRGYQSECVKFIEEYLSDDDETKSALVKMPTGSGKTGIIAITVTLLMTKKKICIITPNEGLLKQIKDEITKEFWENIGVKCDVELEVGIFKNIQLEKNEYKGFDVIITTIQSLTKLYSNDNKTYFDNFKNYVDLVIFDEAHKEPANLWSEAIRAMKKKSILFTATPFRNDNRGFMIAAKYSYEVSTRECIGKYLKTVTFHEIDTNYDSLLVEVKSIVRKSDNSEIVVIHMNNFEDIKKFVISLNIHKSEIAIGFHSRLENRDNCYKKYSFKKITSKTRVIIHQNILKEGINIPYISKIIFADDVKNIRDVVQQIGRALRINKDKSHINNADIYTSKKMYEHYKSQWDLFLNYDHVEGYRVISNLIDKSDELYKKDIIYDESKKMFVNCLSPFIEEKAEIDFDIMDEIVLKKAANIFTLNDKYKSISKDKLFSELVHDVTKVYETNKKIEIIKINIDIKNKMHLVIYKKRGFSDIFKRTAFKEDTYEYFIIVEDEGYIFFNDSSGFSLNLDLIKKYCEEIDVDKFIQLIPGDALGIDAVKLKSASFSREGIYNREFQGQNIESASTSTIERNTVCNRVQFKLNDNEKTVRYIGVTTSRISERDSVDYTSYLTWCKDIVSILKLDKNSHHYIKQFALPVKFDSKLIPASIFIDLQNTQNMELKIECNHVFNDINLYESMSSEVDEFYHFKYNINNIEYDGKLTMDNTLKNPKWNVESNTLKKISDSNNKSLEKIINSEKRIRIMFNDSSVIYMDGSYFKPNIDFDSFISTASLDIEFKTVKALKNCNNEKYGNCRTSSTNFTWPDDSVFGVFIDNHKDDFDYIMCDDMGDEIADFIMINITEKKIVFAHCKHGTSKASGAAFQDVSGQAMKNLTYVNKLSARNIDGGTKIKSWDEPWKLTYKKEDISNGITGIKFKTKRLRKSPLKGEKAQEFWDYFKKIMNLSESTVEVWLYTSGLSLSEFESNIVNNKSEYIKAYTKQLIWILLSTKDIIGQVGATLKVFCKE